MGEAKRRGTFEERRAAAMARDFFVAQLHIHDTKTGETKLIAQSNPVNKRSDKIQFRRWVDGTIKKYLSDNNISGPACGQKFLVCSDDSPHFVRLESGAAESDTV